MANFTTQQALDYVRECQLNTFQVFQDAKIGGRKKAYKEYRKGVNQQIEAAMRMQVRSDVLTEEARRAAPSSLSSMAPVGTSGSPNQAMARWRQLEEKVLAGGDFMQKIWNKITDFITSCLDKIHDDVRTALETVVGAIGEVVMDLIVDLIGGCIPILAQIKAGVDMVVQWGKTAREGYRKFRAHRAAAIIPSGDPAVAFEGVAKLMTREIEAAATEATISTGQFAVGTAALAADWSGVGATLGSAFGAMAAKLGYLMFSVGRDFLDYRAGKRALSERRYDYTMVSDCPILGATMIGVLPSSSLGPTLFPRHAPADPRWKIDMDKFEKKYKDKISRVKTSAIRVMGSNRLVVYGGNFALGLESDWHHPSNVLSGDSMSSRWNRFKGSAGAKWSKFKSVFKK